MITFDKGDGFGYELESSHMMEYLDAGKTESNLMPLAVILRPDGDYGPSSERCRNCVPRT